MEQQLTIKDFLLTTVLAYRDIITTDADTIENYISFFNSIQDIKEDLIYSKENIFLTNIQDCLLKGNRPSLRLEAAKNLLTILQQDSNVDLIIKEWNSFYEPISVLFPINPYQRKEIRDMKNPFRFFIDIEGEYDVFPTPIQIIVNRDLFVGDQLDLTDHHLATDIENSFDTVLFKITERHFMVMYNEMILEVTPVN